MLSAVKKLMHKVVVPSIKLNVLITHEDNEWVAHCLQLDLVATGSSDKAVEQDIIDLIQVQFVSALEGENMSNLYKPAPDEYWQQWYALSKTVKCEVKTIELKSPQHIRPAQPAPMGEVEFCFV